MYHPNGGTGMGRQVAIIALVIVILAAAACGSSTSTAISTGAGGGASQPSVATASPQIYDRCNQQLGRWMTALKSLNSRLDIGMVESDYTKELGNISVVYHEIDFKSLSAQCLVPGVTAEKAFNDYIDADNAWSKCISSMACTNAKVRPKLQAFWAAATIKIDKANAQLQRLRG
jgi:hypothetical protein